jgi:hypothetical protein
LLCLAAAPAPRGAKELSGAAILSVHHRYG